MYASTVNNACHVSNRGQKAMFLSDDSIALPFAVAPYFEFEALVTVVVRAYDTLRFPLWLVAGETSGPPRNFVRTVERCRFRNNDIETAYQRHVNYYNEVKAYRDCVQHYAHFGAALPFGVVKLIQDRVWGLEALIPDNPGTKSYKKFAFDGKVDALSYGSTVVSRMIAAAELTMGLISETT